MQHHQNSFFAGKLTEPSQAGGSLFNIHDSHSLTEIALKGLANSGAYLARRGAAKAVKSDYVKKRIKNVANKYLDQALDGFTSDLSKKISPTGGAVDIHKAVLKVAPKKVSCCQDTDTQVLEIPLKNN